MLYNTIIILPARHRIESNIILGTKIQIVLNIAIKN